jgi:predicted DsbA family dithiol-disulfide isomerase
MPKFQIFYDYECPFCKRGYEALMELLPAYGGVGGADGVDIEWRPIESHPRPENHPPHTDLCVQAYYIARELGADMPAFHRVMFQGVAAERQDVERPEVLAGILTGVVDGGRFLEILRSGRYAAQVTENDDLAYESKGVWFVPAFRCLDAGKSGVTLDAKGGVGVTRDELKAFLDAACRRGEG